MRSPPLKPRGAWPVAGVLDHFGASVDAASVQAISTWLDLLVVWNARLDLTAARTTAELVDLMLADALAIVSRLGQGASVVDVGTGAGAPGLALALLRPDLRVSLVEPLAKRVAFLRTVIGTLGRPDIELARSKGEAVVGTRWDVALSRATLAPSSWLELGVKLAPDVWVFLAKDDPPESPGAKRVEELEYTWPGTGVSRRAVRYSASR